MSMVELSFTMTTIPNEISNREDLLDVRDIIDRLEWLEGQLKLDQLSKDEAEDSKLHEEYQEEDDLLENLLDDLKGGGGDEQWRGDWYPVTLIHYSYFKEYAQQLAEDDGTLSSDAQWPLQHIDWDAAAEALKQDYGSFDFGGEEYLAL